LKLNLLVDPFFFQKESSIAKNVHPLPILLRKFVFPSRKKKKLKNFNEKKNKFK
jgi:hypothetical protein